MARRVSAVVVFALASLPTAVLGLASCCVNSTSGLDFVDDCTCLVDNTPLPGQFLAAGQTRIYHWVLSMDNSDLVSGSVRGNLTFEMAPCNGSASIDIKSGSPSSWQSLPSFNSSDDYNLASVTIPAKFTEQACMVTAGPKDTAFDIAVYTTLYDRPMPGSGGMLSAEMLSAGIARVLINTTETEAANNVKYSLYWSSLPEVDDGTCTAASENATLRENPNCLFWSACGLKNAAEGRSDWVTLAPNVGHVFEVAVDDDSSYLFNVAMMDDRNVTSVYAGTNVSFTATDYQDCVADADCTSQLNDDSTIIAIAAVALAALALLITAMKLLHTSIAKVMRDTVSSRSGQSYLGGTKALFGKRATKGKIHVESFDGVGDDSTPVASPIKRYDGGSSPTKARRREEDDSAESDDFLAENRDKAANRASPKRSSVASPKRSSVASPGSKSTRRQTVRSENDDIGREEDADEGRGGNRSSAASPRSRNRRGRGGKGAEGNGNGDESDATRAPPRSDRDNSISVGESEGKPWQTSASGRSAPSGGTRTHKSPREAVARGRETGGRKDYDHDDEGGDGDSDNGASPRDRKTNRLARSRESSPKVGRKGYDYDDGGDDGDGDNGASPRDRKTNRRGDWESQVARSSTMQGQPRRRKMNANEDKPGRSRRRGDPGDDDDH